MDPSAENVDRPALRALTDDLQTIGRMPAAETLGSLPSVPGLYAWWFRSEAVAREAGYTREAMANPVYVGLAHHSLRGRVGEHLDPAPQRSSPLRNGLFPRLCLYQREIPWCEDLILGHLRRTRRASPLAAYASRAITQWMEESLELSHVLLPESAAKQRIEAAWIRHLNPLLNVAATDRQIRGTEWLEEMSRPAVPIVAHATFWAHRLVRGLHEHPELLRHLRDGGDLAINGDWDARTRQGTIKTRRIRAGQTYGAWWILHSGEWRDPSLAERAVPGSWYRDPTVARFGRLPEREQILEGLSEDDQSLLAIYETVDEGLRAGASEHLDPDERPR